MVATRFTSLTNSWFSNDKNSAQNSNKFVIIKKNLKHSFYALSSFWSSYWSLTKTKFK